MIVRGPRPTADFTVLPNRVLRDEELSYRARGLLAYILSMPDHWETSSARLTLEQGEGRDAVRAAIRELINVGYMSLTRTPMGAGRWSMTYTVRDTPWLPVDKSAKPVDNLVTGA